jgi:ribosomal protein S18 acetylase RimI-like enzyme
VADRHSRFLAEIDDAVILDYVRAQDSSDIMMIGAFDICDRLVGLVEAHPTAGSDAVEVSISVDAAHRRQGLGRRLTMHLLAQAFGAGARTAEFMCNPGNVALSRLVRGLGGRSAGEAGHYRIDRADGTCRSHCR